MSEKKHGGELETQILEGLNVEVSGRTITVKGPKGELKRKFSEDFVHLEKENDLIKISAKTKRISTKKQMAIMGSIRGHINNMMKGVTEGYVYTLKTVYSHFPMKVDVKKDHVSIDNFLGERFPRKSKIIDGVKVTIKAQDITVEGINKEDVGQTAANLEQATRIKHLDIRVFQDGIYITQKDGKPVV